MRYWVNLFFAGTVVGSLLGCGEAKGDRHNVVFEEELQAGADGALEPNTLLLQQKAQALTLYARQRQCNSQTAILIDLGLHSGAYRCFVINLADGSIRRQGLVTHGSGKTGLAAGERKYSNENGSLLSLLGRYRIGAAYQGQFGLAYKLYGLDSTNSAAYVRAIVLHGHECVPDMPAQNMICQSWGCPTVSPAFLLTLVQVINASQKPMLMEIFDSSLATL
jgi:hypothetical protein